MCETEYFLRSIFAPFEPQIQDVFARAMSDARLNPSDNQLVLGDRSHRLDQYQAEFAAIVPPGRVQITWNGIASLWACAQGLARLTRRMFDAQRARVERLSLSEDVELERGLYFYELARRLAKNRFDRWVDWVPPPVATATQGDDGLGNRLFLAALGWIIRHELAHLALQHHTRINANSFTRYDAEVEADEQASSWLKNSFKADHLRSAGQRPSTNELQLEWRALAAGVGLLWVGLFEEASYSPSPGYPAVAERIFRSFEIFDLAEDSFATEIFSYSVKAWIDPEGDWGVPTKIDDASAKAAFRAALIRLHRHINNL